MYWKSLFPYIAYFLVYFSSPFTQEVVLIQVSSKIVHMTSPSFLQLSEHKIPIKQALATKTSKGFHYWSFTQRFYTSWKQEYSQSSSLQYNFCYTAAGKHNKTDNIRMQLFCYSVSCSSGGFWFFIVFSALTNCYARIRCTVEWKVCMYMYMYEHTHMPNMLCTTVIVMF